MCGGRLAGVRAILRDLFPPCRACDLPVFRLVAFAEVEEGGWIWRYPIHALCGPRLAVEVSR